MIQDPRSANQFRSYMRGFYAGAGVRAMDPTFTKSTNAEIKAAYEDGYNAGIAARSKAASEAAKHYGYDLEHSMLRLSDTDPAHD